MLDTVPHGRKEEILSRAKDCADSNITLWIPPSLRNSTKAQTHKTGHQQNLTQFHIGYFYQEVKIDFVPGFELALSI